MGEKHSAEREERKKEERAKVSVNNGQVNAWTKILTVFNCSFTVLRVNHFSYSLKL